MTTTIRSFESLGIDDIPVVGGKNASLGELLSHLGKAGVRVPGGFATTADAFREFTRHSGLADRISSVLADLDVDDVAALTSTGAQIRQWITETSLTDELVRDITASYQQLCDSAGAREGFSVAVRSSATAEDLPDASFAGQQETFLNVVGLDAVLTHVREVFASLYNDRAIAYRVHQKFDHDQVAISAGVQRMVRGDLGASGVMFTLDTESGFDGVVFITSAYGLGESVVQGAVNPDEFYVYKRALAAQRPAILRRDRGEKASKMVYGAQGGVETLEVPQAERARFSLNDAEVTLLAENAVAIENHYGRPMDIEWVRDGQDGLLYIVQARPETVKSRQGRVIERFTLGERSRVLASGRSVGQRAGKGVARNIARISDMDQLRAGEVLVTDMTDPDWEPVMKRSSAIVTNRGGRTCHAAIIARELGIPAVVGTRDATKKIADGVAVTVSCAEGDTGFVYEGELPIEVERIDLDTMPECPTKIMMNVGNPDRAFDFSALPHRGVGLARLEFIINRMIGIHPRALIDYDQQPADLQATIDEHIAGYASPVEYYVQRLAEGIATIAAAFDPEPVIVRMSDFKSNEYANLIGGDRYEPDEENPMLGFRGASRYVSPDFRDCFALECRAMKWVRDEMGLTNVRAMIPFVRTVDEARATLELMAAHGLERGRNDLQIVMMCELPSNALLADQFLDLFDGFSIGSNDLTQLTLGLDRDSALVAEIFDERNPAVKKLIEMAVQACRKRGKYIGICGQGPSDHPDLAQWLVDLGIESMSLNPDTVVETWVRIANAHTDPAG